MILTRLAVFTIDLFCWKQIEYCVYFWERDLIHMYTLDVCFRLNVNVMYDSTWCIVVVVYTEVKFSTVILNFF